MKPHAIHHMHKRKRFYEKLEPFPHPKKWMRWFDNFLLVIAIIGPLMNLPQIYDIFINKNASGVSLTTWTMHTVFAVPWLIYGIFHRDKPIIVAYTLWIILNATIAVGTFIYS